MRNMSSLVCVGIITLLMQSCSQETAQTTPQPSTPIPPANTNPAPTSANDRTQSNSAKETKVAGNSPRNDTKQKLEQPKTDTAGLIPSTNPDRRLQASIKGRKDPFSFVSLMANVKMPEKTPEELAAIAAKLEKEKQAKNSLPKIDPNPAIKTTPIIEPVPIEPTIAKAVSVTGVVDIGGIIQAIVRAPEEDSSRYVEVGQYLSNGQVLVKRIDLSNPLNPIVVLEQSGVEISRKVGETVKNSDLGKSNQQASIYPAKTSTWVSSAIA
jgi:Tfp pilus assembly protein PilP